MYCEDLCTENYKTSLRDTKEKLNKLKDSPYIYISKDLASNILFCLFVCLFVVMFQESCVHHEVTVLHLVGNLVPAKIYCFIYPLRRRQDPALSLHCCFLIALLFLHSFLSRIRNRIYPFELKEGLRGWRLFLKNKKWGDAERLLYSGGSHRVLLGSNSPLFFNIPQSWGEQMLDKKGNNILGRQVSHKPCRGIWF